MAQIQQYAIVSLFVVLGGMLGMDFISGLVEAASNDLASQIAGAALK